MHYGVPGIYSQCMAPVATRHYVHQRSTVRRHEPVCYGMLSQC